MWEAIMPSLADILSTLSAGYDPAKNTMSTRKTGYSNDATNYMNAFTNDRKLYDSSYWYKKPTGLFGYDWKLNNAGENKRDKIHGNFFNSVAASRDAVDAMQALNTLARMNGQATNLAGSIYDGQQQHIGGQTEALDGYQVGAMQDLANAAARSGQRGKSFEKTQRARIGSIYKDALSSMTQSANDATSSYAGNVGNVFNDYFQNVLNSEKAGSVDGSGTRGAQTAPNKVQRGVYASDYWLTAGGVTGSGKIAGNETNLANALSGLQGAQYTEAANPFSSAVPGAKLFQMASQAARRDASRTGATPIDYLRNPRIRQRYKLFS
jgi:hypothetical protein